MLNCYYPLLNDTTSIMVGRGASDIHFRIGIIGRIAAWLCPALQESITFPVAVSSASMSIAQTQVLREVGSAQRVRVEEEEVAGCFARKIQI